MVTVRSEKGLKVFSETNIEFLCETKVLEEKIREFTITLKWNIEDVKKAKNDVVEIRFIAEDINSQYVWTPTCGAKRFLDVEWRTKNPVMMTKSAPVACVFNDDEMSTLTIASSETKKVTSLEAGVDERSSSIFAKIKIGLLQYTNKNSLTFKVLFDEKSEPYYKALDRVRAWWEKTLDFTPAYVPDSAKNPLYSTWYNFHQSINDKDIENELMLAKDIGMKAVITDDGWHTEKIGEGYAYCGDWEVVETKFPNMAQHVKNVHDMGLKYMLWYSIPFVGEKSKAWDRFKDKTLYKIGRLSAAILDPRYPDVREYLISIYENALKKYDLDGFKLDFIDRFLILDENDNKITDEMDYECVQDAADALMVEVSKRLKAIKKDILIEFRQSYIGPDMRKYANMFRVNDCPNDYVSNRIGICDLRLLSGNTAVHSDMLMWNKDESDEVCARQLINALFGAIQVSVKIKDIRPSHLKVLKFYLDFALQNKDVLLNSSFVPCEPQNLYPVVKAFDDKTEIIAVYAKNKIFEISDSKITKIINGSCEDEIYIKSNCERKAKIAVKNCFGENVREEEITLMYGINTVKIPLSGVCEII